MVNGEKLFGVGTNEGKGAGVGKRLVFCTQEVLDQIKHVSDS